MKQFTVIVKPFRAETVLQIASAAGAVACTVREAKGYGRQKGYLEKYAGSEYSLAFLPKVEITFWIQADRADEVAAQVMKVARTGRIGDGKILVIPTAAEVIDF
jgi:nitrogen regulatory protein PII